MNKYPSTIILYCTAAVLILLTTTKKKKKKSILVYALETIVQNLPGNVPVMNTFQVCILLGDAKFCLCLHTLHADQQALVTKQFNHTEDIASENHESILIISHEVLTTEVILNNINLPSLLTDLILRNNNKLKDNNNNDILALFLSAIFLRLG